MNGTAVKFKTTGEGADVILLHGWGCDHSIWDGLHRHLEDRFRVTSIDFPGFGQTAEPPASWGVGDYTAWFEKFLVERGIENPILVGHSFGGRVAMVYGSRNMSGKIILVDAAGIKPRRSLKYYAKVWTFKVAKRILPLAAGKKKAEEMLEKWRRRTASADYRAASPVMRATLSKVVNEDLKHVMPLIKAPTLLVWGEDDTATPVADARRMERLIPDAGLVVFPGAGHYSFLERPAQFAAVIDSFLSAEAAKKM